MPTATDWKRRVTDIHLRNEVSEPLVLTVTKDTDDVFSVDLGPQLDPGEELTNPIATVTQLRSVNEDADIDVTETVADDTLQTEGAVVLQRLKAFDAARWYQLMIHHGAASNRRGAALFIRCIE